MAELLENIGHNIRRLREDKGWNQTELGFHADMSPSIISLIENGKRNPSTSTLAKIADALGVEVVDLFPKGTRRSPFEPTFNDALADERRLEEEAALAVLFRGLARRARLVVERSRREGPSAELGEDAAALHAEASALYRLRGRRDIFGTGSEELADAVDAYEEVEGTIQAMLRQDVEATDEERETARRFRPGTGDVSKHGEADAS
jgi:transcriptional regulator with XRE-family HTH domain